MKKHMLKVFLATLMLVGLIIGFCIIAGAEETPTYVAQVGNTKYETIDEAVANWTHNTELTLLADVTLSDVVQMKSTEKHTLNLGTYTLTAASGKHALEITSEGVTSLSTALIIKADATNPGGIVATGKSCIYHNKKSGVSKDRPVIQITGGVFNGSYAINVTGNGNANGPSVEISGGVFHANVQVNKSKLIISGGTFHKSVAGTGDSSSNRLFKGGRFSSFGFMTADAATKFTVGSGSGVFNTGMYVDAEGYLVVGGPVITTPGTAYQASTTYDAWNSYLKYSSAAANGLYWSDINTAMTKKPSGSITVYVDELDMTGSSFKGKLILPEDGRLSVTFAEGTTPAWSVITQAEGQTVVYTETVVDGAVIRNYSLLCVSQNLADAGAVQVTTAPTANRITLVAAPGEDYYFVNWTSGDEVVGTEVTCLIDPAAYADVQANFAPKTPEQTPAGSFEMPDKIIGLVPGAQYSVTCNGNPTDCTANDAGEIAVPDTWYGQDIAIVKKAVNITYRDSEAQIITLPICYTVTYFYGEGFDSEEIRLFGSAVLEFHSPKFISGMIFIGWYDDADFTVPHNFDVAVTASITLYARLVDHNSDMKKLGDALDAAIANLNTALESKADATTVTAAIEALQAIINALEDAKDDYIEADETLKEELLAAIDAAKQEAIEAAKGYIPHIGENGITPLIRINAGTHEWEVSYDNGLTWSSLGAKAPVAQENTEKETAAKENEEKDAGESNDVLTVSAAVTGTALASNSIVMGAWSILKKRRGLL
ncbi:MAG: hypothetical protein E7585_01510 [Ruminococcaceae bacterium]|nr:hypothetical protein [Oscillospiraceae bacterium]